MIGLVLGKMLNRFCGNSDMVRVVLGVACIILAVYYYWKKINQEWIKLMLTFAVASFMPATIGPYSEDAHDLYFLCSLALIIMGIVVTLVMKSTHESNMGKKKFMRIVAGVNIFALLCFCAIYLYAFLR